MIFSISVTPLDLSNRSAVTQYGQTAVLYITTLAMMILLMLLFTRINSKPSPRMTPIHKDSFRSESVFIGVIRGQRF